MIFQREVIGQFYCKLFLFSEMAKAEAMFAAVEPAKPNGKRVSLRSSDSSSSQIGILIKKYIL